MTLEQKIRMALAYKKISQSSLARMIGLSPSNFNQRLKRESFSIGELEQIAKALEAKFNFEFEFEDGTRV